MEETVFINKFIEKEKLFEFAADYGKSLYSEHLKAINKGRIRY